MPKIQRTRNGGTMTEAEFFAAIRSALRKRFRGWKPMRQALLNARRPAQNNKRLKYEYQCAECKGWFAEADVHIDHIVPCGSLRSFEDLPGFAARLTAEDPTAFQVLCKKVCHHKKTQDERSARRSIQKSP